MYQEYFESVMNVAQEPGWGTLNDARTQLDRLKREYPREGL
jgi:hypothetical protein